MSTPTPLSTRRVGMAVVGLGGAVATTAVAGLELLRLGAVGADGLPLADVDAPGLVPYENLVVVVGTSTTAISPRPPPCTACSTTVRSRSPGQGCRR